jgi:hypothetical protein
MKALKCIASIFLGTLLGLIASCTHSRAKPPPPEPAGTAVPDEPATNRAPKNAEDLPIRQPILE